jgi:hypothetical protein
VRQGRRRWGFLSFSFACRRRRKGGEERRVRGGEKEREWLAGSRDKAGERKDHDAGSEHAPLVLSLALRVTRMRGIFLLA